MKKLLLGVAMSVMLLFSFTACSGGFLKQGDMLNVPEDKNPIVTFKLNYDLSDGAGSREVELKYVLFYNKAPSTVANFVKLTQEKFYDNKVIHYATAGGFESTSAEYIAGGQYSINSEEKFVDGKKNYNIMGEFEANKWETNDLKHKIGSLGMDRTSGGGEYFDTASTAFYFVMSDNNSRDRNYCIFGEVVSSSMKIGGVTSSNEGLNNTFLREMLVLSRETKNTSKSNVSITNAPKYDITFTSVTVETNGIDYSKAKIAKA